MKAKLKHYCDKCKKKGYTKRFSVNRQYPNYIYFGFDLCESCETKFMRKIKLFLGELK